MNDFSVMMVHSKHRILKDLFYIIFDGKERAMCVWEKENFYFPKKCILRVKADFSYSRSQKQCNTFR